LQPKFSGEEKGVAVTRVTDKGRQDCASISEVRKLLMMDCVIATAI
jgi:hypothetical protein